VALPIRSESLGIGLTEALMEQKALVARDAPYAATPAGEGMLARLGVELD
jgi:hypothetical protein